MQQNMLTLGVAHNHAPLVVGGHPGTHFMGVGTMRRVDGVPARPGFGLSAQATGGFHGIINLISGPGRGIPPWLVMTGPGEADRGRCKPRRLGRRTFVQAQPMLTRIIVDAAPGRAGGQTTRLDGAPLLEVPQVRRPTGVLSGCSFDTLL